MKQFLFILILISWINSKAQHALFIPDTLVGASINLTMHKDSVQFFPGQISYTYAYNDNNFLGPTIILNKGDNVNLSVNNQIDDTTTTHWHGLHVPAMQDGSPHTPIFPGDIWYPNFTVMDNAATYWYHPHMHMKTAEQVIKGAAGLIIVRDDIEAALTLPRKYGIDDFPIIVQCQQWDSVNQVIPLGMQDSTLMVNGTIDPYLDAPAQVVRLRFLNASGERAFNFGFTENMPFYQIASDGGLLDTPYLTTRLRLAPGERAEVLVDLSTKLGQTFYLMCYGSELPIGVQGGPTMPMPPGSPPMDSPLNGVDFNILQINVVATTASPIMTIPGMLTTNIPYLEVNANATRTIKFTADSALVMDGPFYFNDSTFNMMRIDYTIPLNSIEVWELINETMVAHPFHIHDVQFYILNRNSIAPGPEESGRKDVVFVLPGDTLRFITKFEDFADPMFPYMYHCHILMHEDDGMMGQFIVNPSAIGIEEQKRKNTISIYPNPVNENSITIELDKVSSEYVSIELFDAYGKLVFSGNQLLELNRTILNLSGLAQGIYILKITNGIEVYSEKILRQ